MEIPNELIEELAEAKRIAILTGAGVSAESGIKTFRDTDGLWTKFNPKELANPEGFLNNPDLVWEWYRQRRQIIFNTKPNPGHYAIAKMEKIFPEFTLITQNIDRHHQKAGSEDVVELHGNLVDNHCNDCKKPFFGETALPDGELPKCESCGGLVRPSVVWFGEILPEDAINRAQTAAYNCDMFFSIGTSAEVFPAANLPIIALRSGAALIEVNPNPTHLSQSAKYCLSEESGLVMPQLVNELEKYIKDRK